MIIFIQQINVAAREIIANNIPPKGRENFLKNLSEVGKHLPQYIAINCWHMDEYESAAMWSLYLKSDESVALQSTYAKLKKSLIDKETIYLGKVKYIDYEIEYIDPGNLYSPFVHKRKNYADEHEVRAIVAKMPTGGGKLDFTKESMEHGLQIKIDIETLIERIFIAPSAPVWFADLVKAVSKKYGYNFKVVHSKLGEKPVF